MSSRGQVWASVRVGILSRITVARSAPVWLRVAGLVALLVVASVVATVIAGVVAGQAVLTGVYMCGPDVSEGTMIAPDSWRGRVLCTDDLVLRDWLLVGILFTAPAAALGVLAWWWRRRSRRVVGLGLVLVVLLPSVLLVAVGSLPAGCTDGQRERSGPAGCERDIESRND